MLTVLKYWGYQGKSVEGGKQMDHLIYSPITADMLGIEICESSIIFYGPFYSCVYCYNK